MVQGVGVIVTIVDEGLLEVAGVMIKGSWGRFIVYLVGSSGGERGMKNKEAKRFG